MRANYCLFRSALAFSVLILLLPAACRAQDIPSVGEAASGGATDSPGPESDCFQLSLNALQTVQLIGVEALVTRILSRTAAKDIDTVPGMSLEKLFLRQQITEAVLMSFLDVDQGVPF